MRVHVCRCVCVCAHVCRCVCVCICVSVCMPMSMCVCVHVWAFVCVGMCECVYVCVRTCVLWVIVTVNLIWLRIPPGHTRLGMAVIHPDVTSPTLGAELMGWITRSREEGSRTSAILSPDCTQCELLPHTPAVEPPHHPATIAAPALSCGGKKNSPSLGCSCQGFFFFFQARRSNWHSVWHRFHTIFPEPSEKTVILFITRLIPSCNIYWALTYSLFNIEFGEPWPQIKFTLMNNVFQRNTYHSP